MSIKVRNTTRYLLTEQLKMTGWSVLALFVVFGILPLLFAVITGNIRQYSPLGNFASLSLGPLFFMLIFIVGSLTYDNFKLLIQMGFPDKPTFKLEYSHYSCLVVCLSSSMPFITTVFMLRIYTGAPTPR